jgi:DNA-directed RNA polymerase specialized sigma subunit
MRQTEYTREQIDAAAMRAKTSDPQAVNDAYVLLTDALGKLTNAIVSKHVRLGSERDDFQQVCKMALMEAVDRFDGARPFTSLAKVCMTRRLITYVYARNKMNERFNRMMMHYHATDSAHDDELCNTLSMPVIRVTALDLLIEKESDEELEAEVRDFIAQSSALESMVLTVLYDGKVDCTESRSVWASVARAVSREYGVSMSIKQVDNALARIRQNWRAFSAGPIPQDDSCAK